MSSNWVGNSTWGQWNVTVRDAQEQLFTRTFDHLVVASGHNQYPYIPTWRGQDAWLANSPVNGPTREIVHSIWYREPQLYANKTVIIVGSGASGQDMASQIVGYANQASVVICDGICPAELQHRYTTRLRTYLK